MLDQLPEEQAQLLLKKLFVKDPLTALRVLQRHFSFEDLVYANHEGLEHLFEALGEETVCAALVGTSDALLRRFADVLGTSKARTFIEDVDAGTQSPSIIEASRRAVLVKAMFLHRKGLLTVSRPGVD